MSEAVDDREPVRAPLAARSDWPLFWFISALGVILVALVVLTEGNVIVIAAPLLVAGLLVLMWRVPLRYSIMVLLFLDIVVESPYEGFAGFEYRTPIYQLGMALIGNLNLLTGIKALKVSGTDLLFLYMTVIFLYRRATRSKIDGPITPTAPPMLWAAWFSMFALIFIWVRGIASGGDITNSVGQVQKLFYIPLFFFLFQGSLRGVPDLAGLGKVLIGAAVYRAILCALIWKFVRPEGHPLAVCTTHADTILFVDGLSLLIIFWNERVQPKRRWLYAILMVIIVAGIVCNNRRIAWVTLTGSLMAIAAISPWTPLKRRIARVILISLPLLVGYVSAGWNSTGAGIFKPAQMIRSVVDSKSDGSSEWRDTENMNLTFNIGLHPWLGTGYGHEYIEYIMLPDVSVAYPQFRYVPHNSVLATYAFAGVFGFTGIWTMLVVLIFFAVRSYHRTAAPGERAATLMCVVAVIAYINQIYGDIGVSLILGPLTIAPAMVVAGKLATSTGAWPRFTRAPAPKTSLPPRATVIPLEPTPLQLPESDLQGEPPQG